jgi:O-antigen ligase
MNQTSAAHNNPATFTRKEKTLCFLVVLFFLILYNPFKEQIGVIGMWPIFVYSFMFNTPAQKMALLKKNRGLILLLLFFILNLLSILWSENKKEAFSWLGIRLALFVLPVALGTLSIRPQVRERIICLFAFCTTIAALGCLLRAIYRFTNQQDASLLYNDNLTDIIHLQSIYFAMLVNLSIFSYVWLWLNKSPQLNKILAVLSVALLLVVHFLLASRVAIFILYSSILVFALVYMIHYKKLLAGGVLIAGLMAFSFILFFFFPKTINRFRELTYTNFNYHNNGVESHFNMAVDATQWNGANLRLAVWQCGWTVIKDHFFYGTGLGDKRDALMQQYASKGFEFGIRTRRNTHNNYVDVWLSMGLTGLVLFLLAFFVSPLSNSIKNNDWLGIVIVISFALALFSETYMDRNTGNIIIGFFFGLLSANKPSKGITGD